MSPNEGVWGGGHSYAHGAQKNFGDLTPYLTYDFILPCRPLNSRKLKVLVVFGKTSVVV